MTCAATLSQMFWIPETKKSVGDTVTLAILRDNQTLQVPVQLGERPTR